MKTSPSFHLIITLFVLAVGSLPGLAQQKSLPRRFSEDSFRRSLRINTDAPMFANETEAKAYRDYLGEWKLEINNSGTYDSNAFQDSTSLEDWRWNYGATLAYDWWTSENTGIVITPSIGFSGQRFDRYAAELDGDLLNVGLNITFDKLEKLKPALTYNAGLAFTPGYAQHTYTEQVIGLEFGHQYYLRKAANGQDDENGPSVAWKFSAGHVFADPEEFTTSQAVFGLESEVPLTRKLALLFNAGTGFRDYTEDSAQGRDTWTFNAGVALAWTFHSQEAPIGKAYTLLLGTNYYHASDRLPGYDADQLAAYISLKFAWEGFHLFGLPRGGN